MVQEPNGVLIVNKHAGVTSHHIVGVVRRLYNTRRVGHAGTLDPMATGVLVVLIGRAAKASEYLSHDAKHYRATLRLGLTTDTEDTTGTVLTTSESVPRNEELQAVLPHFRGKILQIPPMYSALKVDGHKLVDLARRGETVERAAREIEVFSLEAMPTNNEREYILDVHCSGGTYIRTLCADIGAALGCGGAMASLERGEACGFDLSQAHTVDEIEAMTEEERVKLLIPTEKLFSNLAQIRLSTFFEKLCRSGCEIYLKKIGLDLPLGTRVAICDANGIFFALGEVGEFRDGVAVKSIKMFVL